MSPFKFWVELSNLNIFDEVIKRSDGKSLSWESHCLGATLAVRDLSAVLIKPHIYPNIKMNDNSISITNTDGERDKNIRYVYKIT